MVKDDIRLKYSGIIVFASHIVSVALGLAFVLMITRNVAEEEFGIWGNVSDLYGYFILFRSVIPFWAGRFVVREHSGSARTGVIGNLFVGVGATAIYLALVPLILSALKISSIYAVLYVIVSVQILELHAKSALRAILRAKRPQAFGYAILVFEAGRFVLGFIFIFMFKWGLHGALYSMIISHAFEIAFCIRLVAEELKESFKWKYLKEWLKAAPINVYDVVGNRIATFTLILLFVYGGELARGYYGAATSFATIIHYSSFLAFALYPRLLSKSRSEDISASLELVMMFAIPMTTGVMVLSDSYLTILGVAYSNARPILLLLAINGFFITLLQVFHSVVTGTERVDAKAKIAFRELAKSRLFLLFTLPYIQSAIILPATFFALTSLTETSLEAATYLALITMLANSAILTISYFIARGCLDFNFPWTGTSKYVLASAAMAAVFLVIPHPNRLSTTVLFTLLGGALYLTVLLLIDRKTRSLANSVIEEGIRVIKRTKN